MTLVGRPNAGKSTLLNAMVGEKLSIVTSRAQTTWKRVTGIATDANVQMIFLDTPGLLEVRDMLQRSMLGSAMDAVAEADVILLVLDATISPDPDERRTLRSALAEASAPAVAAINKIDAARQSDIQSWESWSTELDARPHRISALHGDGLDSLRDELRSLLPRSPFLYPGEDLSSEPVRFFVAELIRETVFEQFREEIPYSVLTRVEEYRESQDPLYIGVTIFVERDSQKGILVGKGGKAIRELGKEARKKIEDFLDVRIYLDLWVKVLPGWRRRRDHLRRMGFNVPDEHESE